MQALRITLIQADLIWESPSQNRAAFDQFLRQVKGPTDLVILPEMFTTGFTMEPALLAEAMDGPTIQWMQQWAQTLNAVVTGSLIIEEDGHYLNRLIWMPPSGELQSYDKRHLFTLAGEQHHYSAGQERLLVEWRGWRIFPLICYDLRFPVWSRNTLNYDLLVYVANFPDKRSFAWRTLLQARAIENQAYTIGVNRVGTDGNGHYYGGDTCLLDFAGRPLLHMAAYPQVQTITIDHQAQQTFRQKLAFLPDQDSFRFS